jgi:hypothetical protein
MGTAYGGSPPQNAHGVSLLSRRHPCRHTHTTGGRKMNHRRAVCNESCTHRSERGGGKRTVMHLACRLLYWNRTQRQLPKTHWIDAACVGASTPEILQMQHIIPLLIQATGRQRRQMCLMDAFGFPRTKGKGKSSVHGFRSGDIVRATVPTGKQTGIHTGKVAVRTKGSFNITTATGTITDISYRYCQRLHAADGYIYQKGTVPPLYASQA